MSKALIPIPNKPAVARKAKQKKIIIASIAVGATGVLGYFAWKYYLKKKEDNDDAPVKKPNPVTIPTIPVAEPKPKIVYVPAPAPAPKKTTSKKKATNNMENYQAETPASEFPLKKGSKGEKVRQLQEALIAKHGKSIFPKYGADGQFGSEMAKGLAKLKLPATISESVFNVLVQGSKADPTSLATELKNAAEKKDFNKAIEALKKIRNTDGYTEVNKDFKEMRINGGVRQTLVNGMLNAFKKEEEKEAIRLQFLRMGLQYDGKKWSLSGLDGLPLITTRPATVWINAKKSMNVPARTVLGNEILRKQDYILFENKGKYFLVHKQSVSYL